MSTNFSVCVYLFALIYSNTRRGCPFKKKKYTFITFAFADVVFLCVFAELNKNRRKLFEPPIRSSFLEGGASGRLSRQFHADVASVSGRWQSLKPIQEVQPPLALVPELQQLFTFFFLAQVESRLLHSLCFYKAIVLPEVPTLKKKKKGFLRDARFSVHSL